MEMSRCSRKDPRFPSPSSSSTPISKSKSNSTKKNNKENEQRRRRSKRRIDRSSSSDETSKNDLKNDNPKHSKDSSVKKISTATTTTTRSSATRLSAREASLAERPIGHKDSTKVDAKRSLFNFDYMKKSRASRKNKDNNNVGEIDKSDGAVAADPPTVHAADEKVSEGDKAKSAKTRGDIDHTREKRTRSCAITASNIDNVHKKQKSSGTRHNIVDTSEEQPKSSKCRRVIDDTNEKQPKLSKNRRDTEDPPATVLKRPKEHDNHRSSSRKRPEEQERKELEKHDTIVELKKPNSASTKQKINPEPNLRGRSKKQVRPGPKSSKIKLLSTPPRSKREISAPASIIKEPEPNENTDTDDDSDIEMTQLVTSEESARTEDFRTAQEDNTSDDDDMISTGHDSFSSTSTVPIRPIKIPLIVRESGKNVVVPLVIPEPAPLPAEIVGVAAEEEEDDDEFITFHICGENPDGYLELTGNRGPYVSFTPSELEICLSIVTQKNYKYNNVIDGVGTGGFHRSCGIFQSLKMGMLKIAPKTVKPFEFTQPGMEIVMAVISGKCIVRSSSFYEIDDLASGTKKKCLVSQRISCGDSVVIPPNCPYTIENWSEDEECIFCFTSVVKENGDGDVDN